MFTTKISVLKIVVLPCAIAEKIYINVLKLSKIDRPLVPKFYFWKGEWVQRSAEIFLIFPYFLRS